MKVCRAEYLYVWTKSGVSCGDIFDCVIYVGQFLRTRRVTSEVLGSDDYCASDHHWSHTVQLYQIFLLGLSDVGWIWNVTEIG